MKELTVSSMPKTWFLDLDGTLVKHNGYKVDGEDSFLPGAEEFLRQIPKEDMIVITTSRTLEYKELTENFLRKNNITFQYILYGLPYGERILINDRKPSGLKMAVALNPKRDELFTEKISIDETI